MTYRRIFAALALLCALMTPAHAQVTAPGPARTALSTDNNKIILRSNPNNPGAGMLDTLPGTTGGVLPSGTTIVFKNADGTALYAISPEAGATLDGGPTNFIVLGPNQSATVTSDGSNYFTVSAPARAQFGFLSTPTIYVSSTDMNAADTNPGITADVALRTLQAAMDYVYTRFNHGGAKLTIQMKTPGTYPGFSARGTFEGHYGQPSISIPPTFMLRGDPDNPAPYVITENATTGNAVETVLGKSLHVDGVTIQSSTGYGVNSFLTGGEIVLHRVIFGPSALGHVRAAGGSNIWQEGHWTVNGDAPFLMKMDRASSSFVQPGWTITFTGARTFSTAVFVAANGGILDLDNAAFAFAGGSLSGQMWQTDNGGIIRPNDKTALDTLFSGPSPGSGINPTPVSSGGTGDASFTVNGVVVGNGPNRLVNTNAAPNGVLVTNGSSTPSISTTLPTGLAIGTPASGNAANLTGTASGLTAGGVVGVNLSAWTSYPCTVNAQAQAPGGTPPTLSVNNCSYRMSGKTVTARADVSVTAQGTGSGSLLISLPFTAAAFKYVGSSIEYLSTSLSGACLIAASSTTMNCRTAGAGSYIVTGQAVAAEIQYEVP